MRRIPPYIDCILHYLMETCGQVACTVRKRGTIGGGTGGTIRGQLILAESANEADSALHRLHSSLLSDGDLRSGRVHGEDARHNRGRYRRHDPGGNTQGPSISAESANEADSALHRHTSFGEDAAHLFHGGYKGAFKSGTHPTTAPTLLNSQM